MEAFGDFWEKQFWDPHFLSQFNSCYIGEPPLCVSMSTSFIIITASLNLSAETLEVDTTRYENSGQLRLQLIVSMLSSITSHKQHSSPGIRTFGLTDTTGAVGNTEPGPACHMDIATLVQEC
jgi:hypothetical protein